MASDVPAIDTAVLDELLRGSAALGRRMVTLFESECATSTAAVAGALDAPDRDAIQFHAHRLVGSARVVGALELGRTAKALETACREGAELPGLRTLAREVQVAQEAAGAALRDHVDRL